MTTKTDSRFVALDVFRGLTICLMIVVNTPGNYYKVFSPLDHAQWNGCTPTDMVFPSFLFVVGTAISFVISRWQTETTGKVMFKILKRTFIIFLIGYLLMYPYAAMMKPQYHSFLIPFSQTRLFGVLQRIALSYCVASTMFYFLKPRTIAIICVAILIIYWPVMVYFGSGPDPLDIHTNAVVKLDILLWGKGHLWGAEGFPFDPEGFLSTFPAIVTCVAGCLAGQYIQSNGKTYEGLAKLFMAGFACFFIAYWWNFSFPINKKIWTSSFVLHMAGIDCMILSCVIYLLDFKKINFGVYFFQVFGRNPLFIYLLSMLGGLVLLLVQINHAPLSFWIYNNLFIYAGEYLGSLLFAIVFMLFCWTVGYILDKRKIYIKV